jgi:hypothetical protein
LFTRTDPKPLILATSEELYYQREKEIQKTLKTIDVILRKHKEKFKLDAKNYGFAGDLGSIQEKLNQIVEDFSSQGIYVGRGLE